MKNAGLVIAGVILGYASHAWPHRTDISAEQHWHDMGAMAGRYDLLEGQYEAARNAYLKERAAMISVLAQDVRRYGATVDDQHYFNAELVCDADK